MPIRVPHMHLPHIPRHVRRRKSHFQPSGNTLPVDLIYIIHPHRHPHALIACLVSILLKCGRVRPPTTSALRTVAQKNLHCTRPHRPESGRCSPIPQLLPPPLRKPSKTRHHVRHIQYRRNGFRIHSALPPKIVICVFCIPDAFSIPQVAQPFLFTLSREGSVLLR